MEAENRQSVIHRLQTTGFFPIEIKEHAGRREKNISLSRLLGKRIKPSDVAMFNRQMSDLLSAGIPLSRALSIASTQTANDSFKTMLQQITSDVQSGDSFAKALSKHPKVFSKIYISMVRAGEMGGMLNSVLERLADFAEMEEELKGKIKAVLAYPLIMVIIGSAAISILLIVVIPKIVKIFADMGQALPLPTQILIQISGIIGNYFWVVLIVLGIAFGVFTHVLKTEEGKLLFDRISLSTPLIGQMLLKREIARFGRIFGQLLKNGVPILTALEITKDVLKNVIVKKEVERIHGELVQGSGMAKPMRESAIFPPVVTNMVAVGEETGKLDDVLLKISFSYETQVDRSVKTLTSLIEPLIILCLGILVGFIVISMLLPIFTLEPTM